MKSNTIKVVAVAILLAIVLFARLYKGQVYHTPVRTTENHAIKDIAPSGGGSQSAIDPNTALVYTRHARCRMECRHISESDIREVLREGHINLAKSQENEMPCPTYAIEEDRHKDGVRLRIVLAKCDHETRVVTCIDRDHEFECDCK